MAAPAFSFPSVSSVLAASSSVPTPLPSTTLPARPAHALRASSASPTPSATTAPWAAMPEAFSTTSGEVRTRYTEGPAVRAAPQPWWVRLGGAVWEALRGYGRPSSVSWLSAGGRSRRAGDEEEGGYAGSMDLYADAGETGVQYDQPASYERWCANRRLEAIIRAADPNWESSLRESDRVDEDVYPLHLEAAEMIASMKTLEMVGLGRLCDPATSYGVFIPPPPPAVIAAHTNTTSTTTTNINNRRVWAAVLDRSDSTSCPHRAMNLLHHHQQQQQQPGDHPVTMVAPPPPQPGAGVEDNSHPVSLTNERVTRTNIASEKSTRWHRFRAFVASLDLAALLRRQVREKVRAVKELARYLAEFFSATARGADYTEAVARFGQTPWWGVLSTAPCGITWSVLTQMVMEAINWGQCCGDGGCLGGCGCTACLSGC